MKLGPRMLLKDESQSWGDHTIGPKIMENANNYSTAPWRNMRLRYCGKMVHCVNLYKERRAISSYNYNSWCFISCAVARCYQLVLHRQYILKRLVLYQDLQFVLDSHFINCHKTIGAVIVQTDQERRWPVLVMDSKHWFFLWGTAVCKTLSSHCLRGSGCVPSTVFPVSLFVGNSRLCDVVLPLFTGTATCWD